MPTEVIMPMLGMNQDTGKVIRWLRVEGDEIAKGEPLLEIETDKVTVEIEAPAAGTLGAISAEAGDDVPVGRPVALILAAGEAMPLTKARAGPGAGAAVTEHAAQAVVSPVDSTPVAAPAQPRRPLASPKARRLAREQGVSIEKVTGSGPNGAVVAADVERHRAPGAAAAAAAPGSPIETGAVWRVMAERTQRSWQEVPHFFLAREVDATRLEGWRVTVRRRAGGESVTHTDLLVRLVAEALREHPRVNASWSDGAIVASDEVNVGIAVATDDGLVVPVVHGADRLELPAIARRRGEVVAAARERRLRPADIQGGTFTISNLGMFGVDAFMAIVNAPQAAILSVGRIVPRPLAVDGVVVVRPTLVLGLSFDHRVVDGAAGARFLETLASLVEEPAGLVR